MVGQQAVGRARRVDRASDCGRFGKRLQRLPSAQTAALSIETDGTLRVVRREASLSQRRSMRYSPASRHIARSNRLRSALCGSFQAFAGRCRGGRSRRARCPIARRDGLCSPRHFATCALVAPVASTQTSMRRVLLAAILSTASTRVAERAFTTTLESCEHAGNKTECVDRAMLQLASLPSAGEVIKYFYGAHNPAERMRLATCSEEADSSWRSALSERHDLECKTGTLNVALSMGQYAIRQIDCYPAAGAGAQSHSHYRIGTNGWHIIDALSCVQIWPRLCRAVSCASPSPPP